ncbi:probable cytochrome P450 6a13 [Coccinella septempunctata]|uniref:probable cytochrome P450 6a13 n=1 Tax=Coccinella septempunctata TaxID=41139 RepID=UPI001D0808BD|nr:probable cytochrome P450 6a13 [Coccinella septempunctata]
MELCGVLITLIITLVLLFWIWTKNVHSFWSRCGVDTPPYSYIWGHLRTPFFHGAPLGDRIKLIYNYLKSKGLKHGGFYVLFESWYVPMDLDVLKAILQTDFQHFVDRGGRVIEGDPLTAHLLNLKGGKWKRMRSKLTPAFSSGKMKMMFETLLDCTHSLKKVMDQLEGEEVDIKDILGRFTTDIIGTCAFGIECNSLENPENEFRQKGKAVFEKPKDFWMTIYEQFFIYFPNLMKFLNLTYIEKDLTNFFVGIARNTVEYREKNSVRRKDLMDLLIQLKNKGKLTDDEQFSIEDNANDNNRISMDDLAGQAFLFFEAGFETSSTAMTFCLYELAENKDIQDKLRDEINLVLKRYDGKITYDAIMDMPYLEMVLQESLRKYPPIPAFRRTCTKAYKIPGTDIVLQKGSKVVIPVYGIHYDPQYYPDPDRFNPERFSDENRKNRHPCAFLPFGEGPRMCIGLRFGLMEAKVGIITLLKDYEFEVCSRTRRPFEWDPKNFVLSAKGDIWLRHKKID